MKGIKYISHAETSGYALSAAAYIRELRSAGVAVTWYPTAMIDGRYKPVLDPQQAIAAAGLAPDRNVLEQTFHAPVDYDTVVVHTTPEYWPGLIESGKRMVGYTVWETDRIPLHWPALFAGYDLILTPSTFSREILAPHTTAPVVVVPHLPRDDWPDAGPDELAAFRRRFAVGADDFLFYTINTWIWRKAIWMALHAYLMAFSATDRAVFLVKTSPYGESESAGWRPSRFMFDGVLANYPDPARTVFLTDDLSHEDIGLLHLTGDAYVSLSRSEGFGIGVYDAATAGTPMVVTGWGGHLDFLAPEHACLLDYQLGPVGKSMIGHPDQEQNWAHADFDQAMQCMRRLYDQPAETRSRGAGLKAHITRHFDTASITRRLLDTLNG